MDLDELRSAQSRERQASQLQHLRDDFYAEAAEFIRGLRADRRAVAERSEHAFPSDDPDVRRLTNEIETAEEVVESLYERRVGKVVKLSSFAAAGAPTDTDGMTIQEAELFEDLVVRIEQNKDRVLNVLETGADVDVDVGVEAPQQEAAAAAPTADSGAADAASPVSDAGTEGESPSSVPSSPETASDGGGGVLADAMGGSGPDDTSGADASAGSAGDAPTPPPETPDGAVEASTATDTAETADSPGEFVPGSEPDRAERDAQPEATPDAVEATPQAPSTSETATESPGETPDAADANATDSESPSRRTVRITQDVGSILGVDDVEYDLASEDVVSLPADNVAPLLERDAAEPID